MLASWNIYWNIENNNHKVNFHNRSLFRSLKCCYTPSERNTWCVKYYLSSSTCISPFHSASNCKRAAVYDICLWCDCPPGLAQESQTDVFSFMSGQLAKLLVWWRSFNEYFSLAGIYPTMRWQAHFLVQLVTCLLLLTCKILGLPCVLLWVAISAAQESSKVAVPILLKTRFLYLVY